jgi:hypothetical protein
MSEPRQKKMGRIGADLVSGSPARAPEGADDEEQPILGGERPLRCSNPMQSNAKSVEKAVVGERQGSDLALHEIRRDPTCRCPRATRRQHVGVDIYPRYARATP